MKSSVKTQTTRNLKRDQFAELSEGIEALAEARQGKRTPQAHTVDSGGTRKAEDLKVFISLRDSKCDECGEELGRKAWITLEGNKGALCLAGADLEFIARERREFLLSRAIRSRVGDYDEVLIDCPPSLSLLTINALVAADSVLVPLQCEFYALEGLSQLMRTVERVQRALNPRLELQGVVLTMYDQRNNLCDLVAADVRGHLGVKVFDTMIPRNVRIAEAPSHGKPVLIYDHGCAGSQAYIRLAVEILRRADPVSP